MEDGSTSGAPAPASFMFRVHKDWPLDHVFFIKELSRLGVQPSELSQLDLNGKPGWCNVTFVTQGVRDRLLTSEEEFVFASKNVEVVMGGMSVTTLHVFGCPLSLQDGALVHEISLYGRVHGPPKRKIVSHEGFAVDTGTRYVKVSLRKAVPSGLRVGSRTVRVWHKGQIQTCWRCSVSGHLAKDCPGTAAVGARNGVHNSQTNMSYADSLQGQLSTSTGHQEAPSQEQINESPRTETAAVDVGASAGESTVPDKVNGKPSTRSAGTRKNQTPRKHVHTHTVEDENSCDKVKSSADELPENRSWEDVGSEMEDENGGSDSEAFTDVRTRKQRKAKKPIRIRSQPRIWRRSP